MCQCLLCGWRAEKTDNHSPVYRTVNLVEYSHDRKKEEKIMVIFGSILVSAGAAMLLTFKVKNK